MSKRNITYDDGEIRISMAASITDNGKRLLDVGCGDGSFIMRVKDRFDEVFGIDVSPTAVELCRKGGIKAIQVNLNNQTIPYPDGFFDTVVSLEVIEHIFDPLSFLKEIYRVMTPGGILIISTPNIRKLQRIFSIIMGHFPRTSYDPVGFDGGHLHYFTSKDLSNLLLESGFKPTIVRGICGDRRSWKYRLTVCIFGRHFEEEFLSSGILIKARKTL
ncbi:MAG: class I SAM-dependent methyltransferase [Candidatus Kryptoniota bacterium]